MVAFTVVFLILGNMYYSNKIEAQVQKSNLEFERNLAKEERERLARLEKFKDKKDSSILNRVRYLNAKNGEVKISLLGSSVTAGTGATNASWSTLLERHLNNIDDLNVKIYNNGYGGYTTTDLINDKKIDSLIQSEPDVILFEVCLLNNNGEAQVPLKQTKEDVEYIVETFKKELPESLIVLQTANPFAEFDAVMPKTGLSYDQYNNEMKEFIEENGWNFIDTYSLMKDEIQNQGLNYSDVLYDQVHPNDTGYKLWFDAIKPKLESEL